MTVLAPVGTPGCDGIDDTPCVPKQSFLRSGAHARAARADIEALESRGAASEDGAKSQESSVADSRSSGGSGGSIGSSSVSDASEDELLPVACTDYILYSRGQLVLDAVARLPCSLTVDEVPDPLRTVGMAADCDLLPNSVNPSHHLPLVAWFSVAEGVGGVTTHAGYRA
jgi:hypothetical protein